MSFLIECDEEEFPSARAVENALEGCVDTDATLVVELSFVDGDEIRRLNREFRQVDKVTDVLSFPAIDLEVGQAIRIEDHPYETDEEGRLTLGSVAICIERAKEQAKEYGHSFERELHYLLVHGVMHCLGYDHMEEDEKKIMRAQEEKVLTKMGITRSEEI